MSATLAAAALGAAGNIAGGTISTLGQLYANKQNIDLAHQQMQWNERMMDKQNQQELDFWNKQNEYNSPAAQVQRMHEAGLYAGDTANTPAQSLNAASALGYQNPNVQNPMAGFGLGVQQAAMAAAQIENLKADTASKNAGTKTEDELRELRVDEIRESINQTKANTRTLGLEADKQEILNKYLDQRESAEIAKVNQDIKLSDKQIDNLDSVIQKNAKEINEIDQRIKNLKAEEQLTNVKMAELVALIGQANAMTRKLSAEADCAEADTVFYLYNHLKNGIANSGITLGNYLFDIDNVIDDLSDKGMLLPNDNIDKHKRKSAKRSLPRQGDFLD